MRTSSAYLATLAGGAAVAVLSVLPADAASYTCSKGWAVQDSFAADKYAAKIKCSAVSRDIRVKVVGSFIVGSSTTPWVGPGSLNETYLGEWENAYAWEVEGTRFHTKSVL